MCNKHRFFAAVLALALLFCLFGCSREKPVGDWQGEGYRATAFSDEGYYYLNTDGLLCFLDIKNGGNVILCSKVGCPHTDSRGIAQGCEADLSRVSTPFNVMGFWNGYLYYIENSMYGETVFRRNADGTAKKEIAILGEEYIGKDSSVQADGMIIADGYLYYSMVIYKVEEIEPGHSNSSPGRYALCRIDLATGNEEEIAIEEGTIYLAAAKGDTIVYFSYDDPPSNLDPDFDESMLNYPVQMKQWDQKSRTVKVLMETRVYERGIFRELSGNRIRISKYDKELAQHIHTYYDLTTGQFSEPVSTAYSIQPINSNYELHYIEDHVKKIYDIKNQRYVDSEISTDAFTIGNRCEQGFIIVDREYDTENLIYARKEYYIRTSSLADGLQKKDLLLFYMRQQSYTPEEDTP